MDGFKSIFYDRFWINQNKQKKQNGQTHTHEHIPVRFLINKSNYLPYIKKYMSTNDDKLYQLYQFQSILIYFIIKKKKNKEIHKIRQKKYSFNDEIYRI